MSEQITAGDVAALVREGRAALIAGDSYTARQRFRQALDIDPDQVDAWIGMAGSVRPYREKRDHLQRALSLAPDNAEARAILDQVEARIASGEVLAPAGVQVREPLPAAESVYEPVESAPPVSEATTFYCYNHPNRETGLRCTNCGRPICADCVRPAPVGQLCPECAKARRPVNYQVSVGHIVIAGAIALFGVALAGLPLLFILGAARFFSFIIAFLLGPAFGELLVRLINYLTHNKRGRSLQIAFGVGALIGVLPWVLLSFSLGLMLFMGLAIATGIARLR